MKSGARFSYKKVNEELEERIMKLIKEGLAIKVIAERLGISANTVRRISKKLGISYKTRIHQW